MAADEPPRRRGLSAVDASREARGKMQWPRAKFWGYAAIILAVTAIIHWKFTQGELDSNRQQLMARQRAVVAELGSRWTPLRDKVERWSLDLAKASDTNVDKVDKEALKSFDFRDKPGLYLRMRAAEATDAEAIRKKAKESLRDAFTACLVRVPNTNPLTGMECKKTHDCPHGEFCNEQDHCAKPAQPFNLRVAYRTLSMLSDSWVHEVQDANELKLRLLGAEFDDSMRDEIPLAVEVLTKAQYFLLVLDEDPPGGERTAEQVQLVTHPARVAVWRVSDDKLLLRVRREAGGELLGGTPNVEQASLEARQRQANSCALALAVRDAMGDVNVSAVPPQ